MAKSTYQELEEFNDDEIKDEFLEESKFTVLFPENRKKYIQETENFIKKALEMKKLTLELDYSTNNISVKTNSKTRDPFILIKGRDMISLISRGVPLVEAAKVLEDKYSCEIIKIDNLCKSQEVFLNRRDRLEGPNGDTLKAMMLITKTFILVQGKTVCVIGEYKRIKEVIEIVEGCFKNLHPVHQIKRLMVKRELEKDNSIKNEDWKRLLPEVKSKIKNTRGLKKKDESKKEKKTSKINSEITDEKIVDSKFEKNKEEINLKKNVTEKFDDADSLKKAKKLKKLAQEEKQAKKKMKFQAPDE